MQLNDTNASQFNHSKLRTRAGTQIVDRVEGAKFLRINSVFLRARNSDSKANWQTELLKLEELL